MVLASISVFVHMMCSFHFLHPCLAPKCSQNVHLERYSWDDFCGPQPHSLPDALKDTLLYVVRSTLCWGWMARIANRSNRIANRKAQMHSIRMHCADCIPMFESWYSNTEGWNFNAKSKAAFHQKLMKFQTWKFNFQPKGWTSHPKLWNVTPEGCNSILVIRSTFAQRSLKQLI